MPPYTSHKLCKRYGMAAEETSDLLKVLIIKATQLEKLKV